MLLSEAIRLGSLLGPHLKNGWLAGPGNASCAMGAALLAMGVDCNEAQNPDLFDVMETTLISALQVQSRLNDLLLEYFPGLRAALPLTLYGIPPMVTDLYAINLHTCLWQMNDMTRLTRDQIADWLVNNGLDCDSVDLQLQEEQHECQDFVTA